MSPLSEDLSINNNFATNIKNSLGSPIVNSQLNNNNIWLTNLESITPESYSKANLSFLNNFENSRV